MRTAHHITSCLSAKQSKAKQTNDTGPPSPSTESVDPAYLLPLATKNDSNHREVREHAAHSFSAARLYNALINSYSYIAESRYGELGDLLRGRTHPHSIRDYSRRATAHLRDALGGPSPLAESGINSAVAARLTMANARYAGSDGMRCSSTPLRLSVLPSSHIWYLSLYIKNTVPHHPLHRQTRLLQYQHCFCSRARPMLSLYPFRYHRRSDQCSLCE